jgi:chromosome segregation ATPase
METHEEMGFEIARLRGRIQELEYDNKNLTAHVNDLRTQLNRVSVDNEQLVSQNEQLRSAVAISDSGRSILADISEENESLRGMVCLRADECIDFCSLLESVERYNPDD